MRRITAYPTVTCRCCGTTVVGTRHYHCLECTSYDVCLACVGKRVVVCRSSSHNWIERRLNEHSPSQYINYGREISAYDIRSAYSSYPNTFYPVGSLNPPTTFFHDQHRFIHRSDPRKILIYTNGICTSSGFPDARGGWAFSFRPTTYRSGTRELVQLGTISGRLENKGPSCRTYAPTSNRAELRAVIAALQFCDWSTDCSRIWTSLVIATDSRYVDLGVTTHLRNWEHNHWRPQRGYVILNRDLWRLLLKETRMLRARGVSVSFWYIPREVNAEAHQYARIASCFPEKTDFGCSQPFGSNDVRIVPYTSNMNII